MIEPISSERPGRRGRSPGHRRKATPSAASLCLLERYHAAMRHELEGLLADIKGTATGQLGLAGEPTSLARRSANAPRCGSSRTSWRRSSAPAWTWWRLSAAPMAWRRRAHHAAAGLTSRLPPPRWQTPLPATVRGSWGPYVAELAAALLGIRLDRWQRRALNRALAVDADGRLVHRMYLVSTGRQNGKTALVRALIAWALTAFEGPPWSSIAGVAFDRRQAMIPYRAVLADLAPLQRRVGTLGRGGLALTRYLGIRSAMHGRHREYHVFSREARDALRGESIDLAIFDEVRTQRNYETWAALEPTTTARPHAADPRDQHRRRRSLGAAARLVGARPADHRRGRAGHGFRHDLVRGRR